MMLGVGNMGRILVTTVLVVVVCVAETTEATTTTYPPRIVVNGSALIDPFTNQTFRPTGFNMGNHLHSNDSATMRSILPGANVVRLVILKWDNTGNPSPESDCMTNEEPFIKESCLSTLDRQIREVTDANVWVILTCRSQWGAGQDYDSDPESDVFHNSTLRGNMYSMWRAVAARYASWDYIAAYEIMSEPRDKAATSMEVRNFYAGGCAAVHDVDPRTPCMIGSAPYYKLWHFDESIVLHNDTNVIYTFDYFTPEHYIFSPSEESISTYPSNETTCGDLYANFADECCPSGNGSVAMAFDRAWHAHNLETYAVALREKANVPVFMNQWLVVRDVTVSNGRVRYVSDVANLTQHFNIGWAWWVWRGDAPKGGSSAFVYYTDGEVIIDNDLVNAVKPFMSDSDV